MDEPAPVKRRGVPNWPRPVRKPDPPPRMPTPLHGPLLTPGSAVGIEIEREVQPKHMAVIDAWFANGCQSKRAAGMALGLSGDVAHRIFNRPEVRAEVARRMATRATLVEATEERIIEEYSKIAFSNLGDLLEVNDDGSAWLDMAGLTPEQRAAIAEYTVETYQEKTPGADGGMVVVPVKKARVKFHDKKAALDALARIRGMFKDKVEVSGSLGLIERIQKARQRVVAGDPEEG